MCRPLDLYAKVLREVTPKNARFILEIGTGCNQISTEIFKDIVEKNDGQLWTVDIDPKWEVERRFKGVNYICSDSLKLDWNIPLDVLFIDGYHSKDQVEKELEKYGPSVRPSGKIILDDVSECKIGLAVFEFCKRYDLKWNLVAPHPCNLAIIHK